MIGSVVHTLPLLSWTVQASVPVDPVTALRAVTRNVLELGKVHAGVVPVGEPLGPEVAAGENTIPATSILVVL